MSFKRVKVVMLPTNEKAQLWLSKGNSLTLWGKENNNDNLGANQYLYFLSDEEIKVGDWCIMLDSFGNVFSNPQQYTNPETKHLNKGLKKIIATTDKSLKIQDYLTEDKSGQFFQNISLPQPSQSFIEKYVEEYNKGNVITEVMVEYDYRVKSGTIDEHKKVFISC